MWLVFNYPEVKCTMYNNKYDDMNATQHEIFKKLRITEVEINAVQ